MKCALLGIEQEVVNGACRAVELPWVFKLVQTSAGDAGSAGWWAVLVLMGLLFLDPEMRARPRRASRLCVIRPHGAAFDHAGPPMR